MSNNRNQAQSGRRAQSGEQKFLLISAARVESLNAIKIDATMAKVLVDSGLKLRIEIDGNNQAATTLVDSSTGRIAGTIADIKKIAGFRKFAADEKKVSAANSIMNPIEDKITRATQQVRTEAGQGNFLPAKLSPGAMEAIKDSNTRVSILLKNRRVLENAAPVAPDEQKGVIAALRNWIAKSLEVHAALVKHAIRGGEIKGHLSEALFTARVPAWVHGRLTSVNLETFSGGDYRRFLFPADAKKGICFTVREITTATFRTHNEWVLEFSNVQVSILEDQALLRAMFNSQADIDFANEADPIGSLLRGEKVLLTPIFFSAEYLFEPKARNKSSSFAQNPDFSNPRAALRTVIETVVAIQTFEIRTSDQVATIWSPLTEGLALNFRENINAKRNLFRVALDGPAETESRIRALYTFGNDKAELLERALFYIGFRIPPTSTIARAFFNAIGFAVATTSTETWAQTPLNSVIVQRGTNSVGVASAAPMAELTPTLHNLLSPAIATGAEQDLKAEVVRSAGTRAGPTNKKKGAQKGPSSLTALSLPSLRVTKKLKGDLEFLRVPVEEWLRGFMTISLQNAAAGLVDAQLDSLFEVEGDSDDSDGEDPEAEED